MIGMNDQSGQYAPGGQKKGKRLKFIILGVLVALLAGIGSYGLFYLQTQKPITDLPIVNAVTRNTPPHFLFNIYGVNWPVGVAVSHDGQKIYVAEGNGEKQLRIFDRQGRELKTSSPANSTPLTRKPIYAAVGPDGLVYVTDQMRASIDVYDADGNYLRSIKSPYEGKTWAPVGVAAAPNGDIYVSDILPGQQSISVFDKAGNYKFSFGKEGKQPGQMDYPNDIAIDRQGQVYVGSNLGARVDVFKADGTYVTSIGAVAATSVGSDQSLSKDATASGGGVAMPRGLFVDSEGRLYVVDSLNSEIIAFDTSDKGLANMFKFGTVGSGDGQFSYPTGITADAGGRLYVADWYNNRVQVWAY
ncbi:MAG: SMP-30/gluconolactonase/LRE family protein [Chloroflexi bacterium]|nr:SMP-30/gluconolactonase/LRE family protein [Chloroflexota bacterium]